MLLVRGMEEISRKFFKHKNLSLKSYILAERGVKLVQNK